MDFILLGTSLNSLRPGSFSPIKSFLNFVRNEPSPFTQYMYFHLSNIHSPHTVNKTGSNQSFLTPGLSSKAKSMEVTKHVDI